MKKAAEVGVKRNENPGLCNGQVKDDIVRTARLFLSDG